MFTACHPPERSRFQFHVTRQGRTGTVIKTVPVLLALLLANLVFVTPVRAQWLFDATKAETAGNADWVVDADQHNLNGGTDSNPQRVPTPSWTGITSSTPETYWQGALSAWGTSLIADKIATASTIPTGYSPIETLPATGSITYGNASNVQDLSHYKAVVLCEPNTLFTSTEKTAIISYVKNGGSLFMVADHGGSDRNNDGKDSVQVWNDLFTNNSVQSNPFGISFNGDTVTPSTVHVSSAADDPLVRGPQGTITGFAYSSGSTMTLSTTANSTVKASVWDTSATTSAMVAYGTYGTGHFVAVGDSSPFDDGTGDPNDTLYNGWNGSTSANGDNARLILNASFWLQGSSTPEPNTIVLLLCGFLPLGIGRIIARKQSRDITRESR